MSKVKNCNFDEMIDYMDSVKIEWEKAGNKDAYIAASVMIDAVENKFRARVLREVLGDALVDSLEKQVEKYEMDNLLKKAENKDDQALEKRKIGIGDTVRIKTLTSEQWVQLDNEVGLHQNMKNQMGKTGKVLGYGFDGPAYSGSDLPLRVSESGLVTTESYWIWPVWALELV